MFRLRFALPALLLPLAGTAALWAPAAQAQERSSGPADHGQGLPFADQRERDAPVAARPATERAARRLAHALGPQANLQLDPDTGTARMISRLDGTLTGPSEDAHRDIAWAYVERELTALGLTEPDLDTLRFAGREDAGGGLTIFHWIQERDGIPAFDNGLDVAVDEAGRVVSVSGSPVHGLDAGAVDPQLTAAGAVSAVRRNVDAAERAALRGGPQGPTRATAFADGSRAELVLFATAAEDRLAWEVTTPGPGADLYHAVVDADSGRVLYRANLTKYASSASIYPNYPGAPGPDNAEQTVDLAGWLSSATALTGPNTHVYADLDGDNSTAGTEIEPSNATPDWAFTFVSFPEELNGCTTSALCSWDHDTPATATDNLDRGSTQVFWFVNTFHDHLASVPIGFDAASGAFETTDPVLAETFDGAATGPDADHVNNANMSTPPDGQSPRMQMYLFSNASGWFRDVNAGDSAAIVYHEYVHGLSNRLVTTASGAGALNSAQSGAMGEAWSDWYAMDYLVSEDLEIDTGASGEIDLGAYSDAVEGTIRSQELDCAVGADPVACPASGSAGSGGYTYGDFGKIWGAPEVHADGEIWAQTLWDLRDAVGSVAARALVTGGMRLSPAEPSFLDMRNAILAADAAGTSVSTAGEHHDAIWTAFAARGMGFFASTLDAGDTAPQEDFSLPPTGDAAGTVTGKVTDAVSGLPVTGVSLAVGGHDTSSLFDDYFATTSGDGGRYSLAGLPVGTYKQVVAGPTSGYDRAVMTDVGVGDGTTTTRDVAMRRDWAALLGGGAVVSFGGLDYSAYGCGPSEAIDQAQGTGWSADNPNGSTPQPIVIKLPRAITVTSFAVDPGATCGDDWTATLKSYSVQTSATGGNGTWTTAKSGTFSASDAGDMVAVTPTAGTTNVRFVRLNLITAQDECTGCSGKDFIDVSEFAVYGAPPNVLPSGTLQASATTVAAGTPVTFDASSFTDPDSAIDAYRWDFDNNGTIDATTAVATVSHTYPTVGARTAKVWVDDFRGGSGSATRSMDVVPSVIATPVVLTPAEGSWNRTGTVALTGTAPAGATVKISEGGIQRASVTAGGDGLWAAELTGVADGDHAYRAQALLDPGVSALSAARTVRVDTVAPATPVITGPAEGSAGSSPTVTLTGTATPGDAVEVSEDDVLLGTTTADATTGQWSRSVTGLSDGAHVLTATVRDLAGNTAGASRTVHVDTAAPALPSISTPGQDGWSSSDRIALSGTAEPGSTVEVLDGGVVVATATADGDGRWSALLQGVADGTHAYAVRSTDAVGNVSALALRTVRVDTVAPETSLAGDAGRYALASTETGTTFSCRLDLAGSTGAWERCDAAVDLAGRAPGTYTLLVRATDPAGNVDATPATAGFRILTAAEAAVARLAATLFPRGASLPRAFSAISGLTTAAAARVASGRLPLRAVRSTQPVLILGCESACAPRVRITFASAGGRRIAVARARPSIAVGSAKVVRVRLTPRVVRALRARPLLRVKLAVTGLDASGATRTLVLRLRA